MGSVSSCFVVDALPGQKRPGGTRPSPPSPVPAPPPSSEKSPEELSGARLLRRVTLEITGRLPTTEQLQSFTNDPKTLNTTIDELVATAAAGQTLGEAHRAMWRLSGRLLSDLDYFAASNSTLASALTTEAKISIVDEPLALVRKVIADQSDYGEIFSRDYTIASTSTLTLWGYSPSTQVFGSEDYWLANHTDGRPAAGILTSPGFLAAIGADGRFDGSSRIATMLGRLACVPLESASAHDFAKLTNDQLSTDLKSLAVTTSNCAGCHRQFSGPAPALAGYGRPEDLATWLSRDSTSDSAAGDYAGSAITGTAELAASLADDHRIRSCTNRNLISVSFHRPWSLGADALVMTLMHSELKKNTNNLAKAFAILAKQPEFRWGPMTRNQGASFIKGKSGLRFLSRRHWVGLIAQLAPSASIVIPEELDPGSEEAAGTMFRSPSGTYFHHTNRIVRQIATAIVGSELADGMDDTGRIVFKGLPTGSGAGADDATLATQIKAVYAALTGKTLEDNSTMLVNLKSLFTTAGGGADDTAARTSWTAVLVAIMLGPDFLTY